MGSFTSRQFEDLMEEKNETPTPVINKRQLSEAFDPRSPSTEISRTPIHVDKTKDALNSVEDPRSPTVGISRTPLYVPTQAPITVADSINTPVRALSAELNDLPDDTPTKQCTAPETTPACHNDEKEKDSENKCESSTELLVNKPAQTSSINHSHKTESGKPRKSSSSSSNRKPTKLSFKSPHSPSLKSGQTGERSPLGVLSDSSWRRDINSPRAIVQRKQASKLSMAANSPVKYKIFTDDKENISSSDQF